MNGLQRQWPRARNGTAERRVACSVKSQRRKSGRPPSSSAIAPDRSKSPRRSESETTQSGPDPSSVRSHCSSPLSLGSGPSEVLVDFQTGATSKFDVRARLGSPCRCYAALTFVDLAARRPRSTTCPTGPRGYFPTLVEQTSQCELLAAWRSLPTVERWRPKCRRSTLFTRQPAQAFRQ